MISLLLAVSASLLASASMIAAVAAGQPPPQPPDPIMVDIGQAEESDLVGLADVLWGSLGLTGILLLASVLAAGVFAGILFWIRSRGGSEPPA